MHVSEQHLLDLIVLDLAVEASAVPPTAVASVLTRTWTADGAPLPSAALVEAGALDAAICKELRERASALVAEAGGLASAALALRAGLAGAIHEALLAQGGGRELSRQLSRIGARARVTLRELPKGRYRDYSVLGKGGMGVVFLAVDTELNRHVAIKLIRPDVEEDDGLDGPLSLQEPAPKSAVRDHYEALKARFLQEAWVTGNLEHPGIVPIYELGRTPAGVPYYAMRYVQGARTLRDAIAEASSKGLEERLKLLELFLKVCDAIGFAHSRDVVHRDIKPDNVALGDHGEVVVLDWGLAKVGGSPDLAQAFWREQIDAHRDATALETGTQLIGTPGYLPPEAGRGDMAAIDERSDVYSLGVILFEMLTGRRPFEFERPIDYCIAINKEEAPRADGVDPSVPAGLADLCAAALHRDADLRPEHAGALAIAVRDWQARSQAKREVAGWLAQAREALADARDAEEEPAMLVHVDRLLSACALIQRQPGDHEEARGLQSEGETLRQAALASENRRGRRRLLARLGVGLLGVATVAAIWVASALETRRQETLQQQHEKELALDTGLASVLPLQIDLLWPVHPDGAARMKHVLDEAERLRAGIPAYRRKLEALQAALPQAEAPEAMSTEERRLAGSLRALLADIPPLFEGDDGPITRLRRRYQLADSLGRVSLVEHAGAWAAAASAVATDARFKGYVLTPQLGLIPLGADPASHLHEFAHMGSGRVPVRHAETGALILTDDCAVVLVLVPPGSYYRGAQNVDPNGQNHDPEMLYGEAPVHRVELTRPFLIGKYEVTQGQWRAMSEGGRPSLLNVGERRADEIVTWRHPVESVNWHDCQRLAEHHRLTLPEHAYWEYAARGGMADGRGWPHAGNIPLERFGEYANVFDRKGRRSWAQIDADYTEAFDDGWGGHAPVGSFKPNAFGLHDMLGNIGEWVYDVAGYRAYKDKPAIDPKPTDTPATRGGVTCGGSYNDPASVCRVSMRSWPARDSSSRTIGARFAAWLSD